MIMKLTTKLLLKPTPEQKQVLLDTMKQANAACDSISQWCWENKTFGQYKIHHGNYHTIKGSFYLSAQMVIRCIAKVCDSYKLDKKRQRSFRKYGSVAYDSRILSYKGALASIWTIEGRQKIPFVTAEHHAELLKYAQGEADLAYVRGKLYLLQTCDVPHEAEQEFDDCIGVDLGITNIASTAGAAPDDTDTFAGKERNQLRQHRQKVRKAQRGLHNRWSFHQLQSFIQYKAKRRYSGLLCAFSLYF